jgi:para-nitrobenzyl esterase
MNPIEVETSYGKLRGARQDGVSIFRGIPYAGRVSGDRRFRRPAELEPWPGVRDALQLGAPAIQPPRRNEPEPAEDCLFLNIWTPAADNRKRPVMFYNHGGGFVIGSGGSLWQDGANLARNFDVVVVQTNHRLGLLGFLYLDELGGPDYAASGNQGLLDIVAGLAWVNENISAFGGDPDNVMIFGESGGGAKTSCLYAMPHAAAYFNKASIESGPGVRMYTREMAAETTALVLRELDIAPQSCLSPSPPSP